MQNRSEFEKGRDETRRSSFRATWSGIWARATRVAGIGRRRLEASSAPFWRECMPASGDKPQATWKARYIVGESPPKYGDHRNSSLMVRRESRGGRATILERTGITGIKEHLEVVAIERERPRQSRPTEGGSGGQTVPETNGADRGPSAGTAQARFSRGYA